MATWLHDADIYAALAEGEPGPARDWGTTRLALAAPERFVLFPDDERCHDVVLAANPPRTVHALIDALKTRRPCPSGLANAAAALGMYGLLPEDTEPLAEALKGALRDDGDDADLWLAYALSMIGAADTGALAAAAKAGGTNADWVLPIVLLRVAERQGALEDAAREVAADIASTSARDPHRLIALLVAMGVPIGALAHPYRDPDEAVRIGAAVAHADAPSLRIPPGSARRRQQHWVRGLLEGIPGPAAALLRHVYTREPLAEWQMWPVAVASWMKARQSGAAHGDVLHDILAHSAGGDPVLLSSARRHVGPLWHDLLVQALADHPDTPTGVLAVERLRQTGDRALAHGLLAMHGGDADVDVRTAAFACVAGFAVPDEIPAKVASADKGQRVLGLVCAEWTPTTEVLEALLSTPVPADPRLRVQYARALASMADAATVPVLEAMVKQDEQGELAEPRRLAEELLRQPIG